MSRHRAIDLTLSSDRIVDKKRKLTPYEKRELVASDEAINKLLQARLKSSKSEDIEMKSSSSGLSAPRTHVSHREVPVVEWWDEIIQNDPSSISHLIEHPVPLKGIKAKVPKQVVTQNVEAMLTEEERRKLRKLRNQQKVQEFQDKIKMGLIPPPPPKIKMKNLMRVLGSEQVAEPSAIEKSVRAQVEQRLADHVRRNEERKLTPEARREKTVAKWTKSIDNNHRIHISVFLVFKPINNKIKFKINKSGEELHLGGFFLHCTIPRESQTNGDDKNITSFYPSLIVAEGSQKSIKRFDRILLKRINWLNSGTDDVADVEDDEEEEEDDSEEQVSGGGGVCRRIFRGIETSDCPTRLKRWSYLHVRDLSTATSFLSEKNSMTYWDMLLRYRDEKLDI